MSDEKRRKCGNCEYWRNPKDGVGWCHGAPPAVVTLWRGEPVSWWPETVEEDDCGVHRFKSENDK